MTVDFHPAKARPRTALVLTFAYGILLQALWHAVSPPLAVSLWVLSLGSLRDFFLPTTYRLEESGLTVEGPLKSRKAYPWTRFRSFICDRNGLFLSPYRSKRASESRRGVFLPLSAHQRACVKEFCLRNGLEARAC